MGRVMICIFLALVSCTSKDVYDVNNFYDLKEQDEILTGIVTYIFEAPPYTLMPDRFKPEHRNFYSLASAKFKILKFFIGPDGTHYFYVLRPSSSGNKRGAGGHFRLDKNLKISDFREVFVTPALPESEVTGRCAFLFDEMVKGKLEPYLKMPTYVQWPNEASYYDTVTYEWKLKPEFESN